MFGQSHCDSVPVGRIILAGAGEEAIASAGIVSDHKTILIDNIAQFIERHTLGMSIEK